MGESDIFLAVERLIRRLGVTLVSTLAGASNTRAGLAWITPDLPGPSPAATLRLRCAAEVWRKICDVGGGDVARAWFIGANPWLNDDTVITALREDRFTQVDAAVDAFLNDTFSG